MLVNINITVANNPLVCDFRCVKGLEPSQPAINGAAFGAKGVIGGDGFCFLYFPGGDVHDDPGRYGSCQNAVRCVTHQEIPAKLQLPGRMGPCFDNDVLSQHGHSFHIHPYPCKDPGYAVTAYQAVYAYAQILGMEACYILKEIKKRADLQFFLKIDIPQPNLVFLFIYRNRSCHIISPSDPRFSLLRILPWKKTHGK